MRSSRLAAVAFVALLPACKSAKGVEVDAALLVPKDASLVIGFDVKALRDSKLGGPIAESMATDPENKARLDGFAACNVNTDDFRGLIAGSLTSETSMIVLESPGLGDEDVVRCVEKEIGKSMGQDSGLLLFETKGDVRTIPQEGGGQLIILNKNAVILADAPWDIEVLAAIESADKRNTGTPMATLLESATKDSDVFVAATIGAMERTEMGDLPGSASLETVLVKVGLTDGVKLDAKFDFGADADAEQFRGTAPVLVSAAKSGLAGTGMPEDLFDNLVFAGEGKQVTATWSVAADVVPKLVAAAAGS